MADDATSNLYDGHLEPGPARRIIRPPHDWRFQIGVTRKVPTIVGRNIRRFAPIMRTSSGKVMIPVPRVILPYQRESTVSDLPCLEPFANEETVTTSVEERLMEGGEGEEMGEEMNEEHVGEDKMHSGSGKAVHTSATSKLLVERQALKSRLTTLTESNSRMRMELMNTREENKHLQLKLRRAEKTVEKQALQLAHIEAMASDLRRKEREAQQKSDREKIMHQKRKKLLAVVPCLPNRKVCFSRATKQAQSLRVRLLNKYLSELVGPVESERRLEEKNMIVLRWRKSHAPRPSLEIGRQLLPSEEGEFCRLFNIDSDKKKEMKRWLGHKHIDLFGPSERALKVREWRRLQRERKARGEVINSVPEGFQDEEGEAGKDSDEGEELLQDVEEAFEVEEEEDDVILELSDGEDPSILHPSNHD